MKPKASNFKQFQTLVVLHELDRSGSAGEFHEDLIRFYNDKGYLTEEQCNSVLEYYN